MRVLANTVYLYHGSDLKMVKAGDPIPSWAVGQITNPLAWADYEPPTKDTPAPTAAPVVLEHAKVTLDETIEVSDAPPRGGPGSGRSVWQEFAKAHEVEVSTSASKAEIIAACEAAGII